MPNCGKTRRPCARRAWLMLLCPVRARGGNRPGSDIDIMIEIDPEARIGVWDYAGIKDYIAGFFNAPVDVVSREGLKPLNPSRCDSRCDLCLLSPPNPRFATCSIILTCRAGSLRSSIMRRSMMTSARCLAVFHMPAAAPGLARYLKVQPSSWTDRAPRLNCAVIRARKHR